MLTNDETNDEANNNFPAELSDFEAFDYLDSVFQNPVHVACKRGERLRVFKFVFSRHGPDVFKKQDKENRWNAVHHACIYSASLEVIKFIVEKGGEALIKQQDEYGMTPLHWACNTKKPSLAVVKYLVEKGGKEIVKRKDATGWYPLHTACRKGGCLDVIEFLVEGVEGGRDALDEKTEHGWYPHHCAYNAEDPSFDAIHYLLAKSGQARFYLHHACQSGAPLRVIKVLVDKMKFLWDQTDTDIINEKDTYGKYPLHYACDHGASLDVIEFLVNANQKRGRDVVTEQDIGGWNALHYACACEDGASFDVIKFLVDKGGKEAISKREKSGRTPLDLAHEYEASLNVIVYLVLAGGKSVYGDMIGGSREIKSGNPKLEIRNILLSLWNSGKMSGIEKLTDIKPPKDLIDPKNNGNFAGLMELCDIVLVDDGEKELLFMDPETRKNNIENHKEKVNSIVDGIQDRAFSKMREYDGKKAKQTKPTLATGKRYLKYKNNAAKRARMGI